MTDDMEIGDRHLRPDPAGALMDASEAGSGPVIVRVATDLSGTIAGQHLLFMVLNLLSRQDRLVSRIIVSTTDEPLNAGVWPFAGPQPESTHALVKASRTILGNHIPIDLLNGEAAAPFEVLIGNASPQKHSQTSLCVFGEGWRAYAGPAGSAPAHRPSSTNPIGPYFAACLVAGEVFKFYRQVRPGRGRRLDQLVISLFEWVTSESWDELPPEPADTRLHLADPYLVGAGAVGQAAALTLGAFRDVAGHVTVIDPEALGDATNLNRYPLTRLVDVEQKVPKAEVAGAYLRRRGLSVHTAALTWQDYVRRVNRQEQRSDLAAEETQYRYRFVLSCVDDTDGNHARHAIQNVWPNILFGASTHGDGLRATSSMYDAQSDQMCLKCHNPLRDGRKALSRLVAELQHMNQDERRIRVSELGLDPDEIEIALNDPGCASVGMKQLADYANRDGPPNFSVGFTSLAAGVMLAARVARYALTGAFQTNTEGCSDFFYFLNPGKQRVFQSRSEGCSCGVDRSEAYLRLWGRTPQA